MLLQFVLNKQGFVAITIILAINYILQQNKGLCLAGSENLTMAIKLHSIRFVWSSKNLFKDLLNLKNGQAQAPLKVGTLCTK